MAALALAFPQDHIMCAVMAIALDEKAKRFGVRLPESVIAWIEAEAARRGVSSSRFVRAVLVAAMDKRETRKAKTAA